MMRKIIGLIILLWVFYAEPAEAYPGVSSQFYCLLDADTGQVIVSGRAGEARQVASTTKIMTAVLTAEYIKDLQETATVSRHADRTLEYTIGLKEGQQLAVDELLKACLIKSSNDAAVVLAEHVAGDERFFAYLMSKKAWVLGAGNTFFVNASGLPDERNLSTAYDLAVIGNYALNNQTVSAYVGMEQAQFHHPGYREPMILRNTNGLLTSFEGANGIKTGTANDSGQCLVGSATRDGKTLIAVVLKSGNRTGDCIKLLNYGFNQVKTVSVLDKTASLKTLPLQGAKLSELEVYPEEDIFILQGNEPLNLEKKLNLSYLPELPVQAGEAIGRIDLYTDGIFWRSVKLVAGQTAEREASWPVRIWNLLRS